MREEDVPTEQPEAEEEARLPAPDAHPRRPRRADATPVQGPPPAVGLIWRVRDRASFRALAAGSRRRLGGLTMSAAAIDRPGPARVAFAVGRHAGNAVTRNRVRRRLRAAVQAEADAFAPSTAYLIRADARALRVPYAELRTTLRAMAADVVGTARP
jgi:ribonuclease P protein component